MTSLGPLRSNTFACEQSGAFKIERPYVDNGEDWEGLPALLVERAFCALWTWRVGLTRFRCSHSKVLPVLGSGPAQ
jgi:hypothetical protein